jgi:Ni/Fe-hydrogenase subunit HybB-like protein
VAHAIARFAEAMTIFAVICAAIFPTIHGAAWLAAYWLFPIPTPDGMWVNFNSPLLWDVFAVSTYFTVSLLFWYVGLIPDLASAARPRQGCHRLRSTVCCPWAGAGANPTGRPLREGLPDPGRPGHPAGALGAHHRVLRLRGVGLPGWHTTIFPPYFVAGAIFSGFAMVVTLAGPGAQAS